MADKEELYKELERGKVLAIEIEADSRNELLARATTRAVATHGPAGQRQSSRTVKRSKSSTTPTLR